MPAHAAPGDAEIVTTRIQLAQATAGTGATATTPLPTPIGAATTPAPAPAVTPIVQSRDSFWHAPLQQLPPLTSRPELYGQPQSLMLHPLTPIQLHQGPWGVFNANTGAASGFGTVGYYAVARWAEDWSSLRDKRNRHDFLDPLKYIALNDSGSIYLTLSGNFRHHGFWEQHPALGAVGKSHTYLSNLRTNLGADLHLGEHVRFYGELMSGQATGGNKFGYNARWRNRVDAQQAFVEVRGRMLGATMGAMVGRMSFLDVPPNISAGSVYPSIPYSWNGLRGYSVWKRFRVDLFDLSLTNYEYRAFHDQVGWKTRLFGAYTSYAIPEFKTFGKKSQIFVDTYYLGYLLASSPITATKGVVAGSTHRDTPGMRVWGNAGPIEFSASGMWQGGNFQAAKNGPTRPVSAYSFNASVAWRFANWWGRPAIGIQADDISGGDTRRSATSTWGGFLSPFVPSAYYLDLAQNFNLQNVIDVGPLVTMSPTINTSLLLRVPVLWRNSIHDTIYFPGGVNYAYRPSGGYSGVLPQGSFTWRATRHVTFSIDGQYTALSRGLRDAGAKPGAYFQTNLELTF